MSVGPRAKSWVLLLLLGSATACSDSGPAATTTNSSTGDGDGDATGDGDGHVDLMPGECGGPDGVGCPESEFCQWEDQSCGLAAEIGTCVSGEWWECWGAPPVCGCDGMDYADGCAAAAHGVDVDFVGPCDGSGWNPPSSACDPLAQDCPEDEKCVPYASTGVTWDDTKCVPILGDVPIGEPCVSDGRPSATDDCDADGHCWNHADVDGLLVGVCAPFCAGTPDDPSCAPDSSCLLANEASIALCLPSCDPLTQDCGAGLGCLWGSHGFVCTSLTQSVAAGQPCTFTNDCAAGLGCFDAELIPACAGVACCAAYCSVDDPDACPDLDLACGAFFGEGQAQPGLESLGVCVVPNTWGVDTDGCRLSMPPTTLGI